MANLPFDLYVVQHPWILCVVEALSPTRAVGHGVYCEGGTIELPLRAPKKLPCYIEARGRT